MSYGRLLYAKAPPDLFGASARGRWVLADIAPHVAIAFKRLFPRVPVHASVIELIDTDEIRADLEWFMLRYPLDHSCAAELAAGRERIEHLRYQRERILLPSWDAGEAKGFINGHQPYRYQRQAAAIALANPNLLLGDDVGLGKTISAAAMFAGGAPLPAAVVVQAHLAYQWSLQIREFTNLTVHIVRGRQPYDLPPADVYIFRYSNIAGWTDVIAKGLIRSVAFDEIQELRHGTETSKGIACEVLSARADLTVGLTATPIYNYGDEIHTIMGYIKPGLLGDRSEFMREWCGGTKVVRDPDGLGSYLRDSGFFLRRTEDDPEVSGSMPPVNIVEWEADFDDAEAASQEAINRALAMAVLNGSFVEAGRAARELDARMRLLTGVAKARSVAAYCRMLLKDAPRIILAGWHRDVYSIWLEELEAYAPLLYSGSETAAGKNRHFRDFIDGRSRILIMSLRSGSGLDGLQQHCSEVVFGELDWSPQVHYQLIGRLRRPGQEHQVTAHYLHANSGSDPVLIEMLGIKTDQARGINDPGIAPKPRYSDASRIQRLAEFVLSGDLPAGEAA